MCEVPMIQESRTSFDELVGSRGHVVVQIQTSVQESGDWRRHAPAIELDQKGRAALIKDSDPPQQHVCWGASVAARIVRQFSCTRIVAA